MMQMERAYIAYDRAIGVHSLIRPITQGEGTEIRKPTVDLLNDLLMARNPSELFNAASRLGPFFTRQGYSQARALTPEQAYETFESRMVATFDVTALVDECYADPFAAQTPDATGKIEYEVTGRSPVTSTRKLIEDHDYCSIRPDFRVFGNAFTLLVEPLGDWALLRNVLSILLRIGATLREASPESVLESSGFMCVPYSKMEERFGVADSAYLLPILRECRKRRSSLAHNGTWSDQINESIETAGGCQQRALKGHPEVMLLKDCKDGSRTSWLYLAIARRRSEGQLETANRLLNSFDKMLDASEIRFNTDKSQEIGMPPARSIATAVWRLAKNHPGRYLMTCKNCHRTILSGTQGGERRFCSDSCRAAWNKAHTIEKG